jgi:hypothetical protein
MVTGKDPKWRIRRAYNDGTCVLETLNEHGLWSYLSQSKSRDNLRRELQEIVRIEQFKAESAKTAEHYDANGERV